MCLTKCVVELMILTFFRGLVKPKWDLFSFSHTKKILKNLLIFSFFFPSIQKKLINRNTQRQMINKFLSIHHLRFTKLKPSSLDLMKKNNLWVYLRRGIEREKKKKNKRVQSIRSKKTSLPKKGWFWPAISTCRYELTNFFRDFMWSDIGYFFSIMLISRTNTHTLLQLFYYLHNKLWFFFSQSQMAT